MNKQNNFDQNDYEPRTIGLVYDPPQIIIEYFIPSMNKLKHHKIKLTKLKSETNIEELLKEIYDKHKSYLDPSKISQDQIIQNIEKLRSNIKQNKNTLSELELNSNADNMLNDKDDNIIIIPNNDDCLFIKQDNLDFLQLEDEEKMNRVIIDNFNDNDK